MRAQTSLHEPPKGYKVSRETTRSPPSLAQNHIVHFKTWTHLPDFQVHHREHVAGRRRSVARCGGGALQPGSPAKRSQRARGKWLGHPPWSRNPGSRFPFSGNCDLALLLVAFTGFRNQPVHHRSVVNYDQLQNRFLVPILAIVTAFTVHICHFWVGTLLWF